MLGILDKQLTNKQWLLGDQFTLADVHVVCFLGYFKMCGVDLAPYANVDAWIKRAEARPAAGLANAEAP